ncbi:MAG: ferredoxin [Pseudomonadota bacterium]
MTLDLPALEAQAADRALAILGGFHEDGGTILLLGPDPTIFWPTLQAAPEALGPDPVDRWSTRVIGTWAAKIGAEARFPFGHPVQPFVTWALKTGRCHVSPVGLLVHDAQGLLVSFRGALVLDRKIALPAPPPRPCDGCPAPCRTACPVDALSPQGYDIPACRAWLAGPEGNCMAQGCAARRACPVSPARPDAQAAHHMRAFAGEAA